MTFSQPAAGGDTFEPKNHLGRLLLVYPKSYDPSMKTKASVEPTQAADVDIIIVDEPGPDGRPTFLSGARLFGNLAKSVRNDLGGQVLGRLAQGQPSPGRTAPWILTPFTDQDAAMAGPHHAAYQAGQFKAAENPMSSASAAAQPAAASYAPPQATPAPPPAAAQWQHPAAAPQAPQQWAPPPQTPAPAPPGPPAAPAPAPAPAGGVDPNLVAFLASKGVTVTPEMDQATAEAIARSFPQ